MTRARRRPVSDEGLVVITGRCMQRCPFCFAELTGRPLGLSAIARRLEALPRRGRLVVSGGEPGTHPRLAEVIALARRLGFAPIVVQTNAVAFAAPGLAEALGPLYYFVSFHSHAPEVYDALTGSRGQQPRALEGLRRLLVAPGASVVVNVVLTRLNLRAIKEQMDFLADLAGGRRLTVSLSLPNQAALERCPELVAPLEEVRPALRAALARCDARGLPVWPFSGDCAPPACLADAPLRRAATHACSQTGVRYAEACGGVRTGRLKRPSCRRCACDDRCRGVPALYAERFGLAALTPVPAARTS